MASRRTKILGSLALLGLAGSAYFGYTLFAAQGQNSTLAQYPMNSQVQIPAAFVMALDDSGSMRFQTLFPSRDGGALWARDSTTQPYGFFYSTGASAGQLRRNDTSREFVHVAPYPAPRQAAPDNDNAAIPPIDEYGFSRSHVYNRAYFDPNTVYEPWKDYLGNAWTNATPTATRVDPNSATPVVNLTVERTETTATNANHHAFRIRTGMVLPTGMKYNGAPGCGLTNAVSNASTPTGWRVLTSNVTATCDVNAYIAYFPATFYLPTSQAAPAGFITANRTLATNACTYRTATGASQCNMYRYEIRPTNYTGGATGAAYQAAIQNFANWFSFYGARNRSVVNAVTNSLATVNNMRVGYFTINNRVNVTMRDMAVPTEKQAFYNSIVTLGASGQTPNLPAVAHLGEQFRRTGTGAPIALECQKNAGMLFTDGFSNIAQTGYNNVDQNMGVPFADAHSNTLADIATKYYLDVADGGYAPLRSDAGFPAGRVPISSDCPDIRKDCQPNLHMNFYGVTLGASGVTFNPDVDRDPFVAPYISWPAYESNQRSTVDDIWHATVNTRGEFISARTPADITAAMRRILSSVSGGSSPSGSIAVTGARIGPGSLTVTPSYRVENEGTDWSGTLSASQIGLDPVTRVPVATFAWEASTRFPSPTARGVYFTRAGTTARFNSTNVTLAHLCASGVCTAAEVTALGTTATQPNAIDYLLGNTGLEKQNGGPFRDRSTRLGDIVNSTPVVSSPTDDYGYGSLGGTLGSSYRTYLQTTKATRRYMVYVGANDGMLHGFDGGLTKAMVEAGTPPDTAGGRELFGYVPETSLGRMGNLLFPYDPADENDQKFRHLYYVDGPITVSDAYYGGGWHTSLVGTAGAGGRSVFALDVSTPASFGASSKLWEISDLNTSLSTAVRNNIGHVLGKPIIVPVKNTSGTITWKAIFGNGYESANGRAVLFLVDIGTGTPNITMIEAQEVSPGLDSRNRNGLGNIVVVDRWGGAALTTPVRDGYADTVYAADQQGAVWKFDIRSATPSNVTIPLFTTQVHNEDGGNWRQPILGGLTAASGPNGGVMLYFGTGSYSFLNDGADNNMQSLYAVNDLERGPTTVTIALSSLVRYTVSTLSGTNRTVVRQPTPPNPSRGWYVNLPAGERFVGYPEIAAGVVFMPTYTPNATSLGCSTGGFNSLFGLNSRTGAAALSRVKFGAPNGTSPQAGTASVGLDTGGSAPVKDVGVMAIPRQPPPTLVAGPPPAVPPPPPPPPEQGCWMMVSVAGAQAMYLPYPCGRQSWRQIQ